MVRQVIPPPTFLNEQLLWEKGYDLVIGLDEVGRGAFAGPVVVGAVAFKKNFELNPELFGIHDSKLLAPQKRLRLSEIIKAHSLFSDVELSSVNLINRVGIGKATEIAFRKLIAKILTRYQKRTFILVDGFHIKFIKSVGLKNQRAIVKGDQKSISIAAASIVAKVYRDNLMNKLHEQFPQYQLKQHKGYGTLVHRTAIKLYGVSKIHRVAFCHL